MTYRQASNGRDTIVVRGDLFSDSGYGRATRALSSLLAAQSSRLFGISLHAHADRKTNAFPFPIINERALFDDPNLSGASIVHVCLPNAFLSVPMLRNIGYFFWETEQVPPREFWKAKLRLMDEIWAPSHWQADVLKAVTGRVHIPVVPWPQTIEPSPTRPFDIVSSIKAHPPQSPEQLSNYLLRVSPASVRHAEQRHEQEEYDAGRSTRFDPDASPTLSDVISGGSGDTFLAIQTDAPRKGLSLLLAAWLQFRQMEEGRHATLLIKASSIDVTVDMFRLHFQMSLAVRRLMRRLCLRESGVFFIYDRLSDDALRTLTASCDALVSATMGEGFGGPLTEAFLEGVPVIGPNHTACRDILGADYPLAVSYVSHRQKLWHNIDVYSPSSMWNIVDDASMVERLRAFTCMPQRQRDDIASAARARIERTMGRRAVNDRITHIFAAPHAS